jgi:hypothetical protein
MGMDSSTNNQVLKQKWETEFEIESNRFTIRYNDLQKDKNDKIKYTNHIVVDRRITVEQMKNKICEHANISMDQICFKRGGSHGAELVEDDLTLK